MEDFIQEIGRGSSMYLLYGDSGVGKSRLLQQMKKHRLLDRQVRIVDFEDDTVENFYETIKAIAELAKSTDVIIFDHFEVASNKAQHQIFNIWSTDGLDKGLNIIVCVSSAGFNDFRQLAKQYRIEVKGSQLIPCNEAESEAYLRFHLFPEQPFGKLEMSSAVKRLIRRSDGLYSRLIEIAERESGSINIRQAGDEPVRVAPIALIFLLILLVAGVALFYYLDNQPVPVELSNAEAEFDVYEAEQFVQEQTGQKLIPESIPEPELELQQEINPEAESQPGIEPTSYQTESSSIEPELEKTNEPSTDMLQSRLQATLDWIKNSRSDRGTIQIMSINFDRFDDNAFQAYLDDLREQGIDTPQIGIFRTKTASEVVYSLIYGDYVSRQEANDQISRLPKALAANNPITRSAGSIAIEIARYFGN